MEILDFSEKIYLEESYGYKNLNVVTSLAQAHFQSPAGG